MPVLLTIEQAPGLHALLRQANAADLSYILPATGQEIDSPIQGLGSLKGAGPTEISFLSNPRLHAELVDTHAAAVILTDAAWTELKAGSADIAFQPVICDSPYVMYAQLAQWFDQHRINELPAGIHPTAIVDPTAVLGDNVSIGPYCVIEAKVQIGNGTRVGAQVILGAGSVLGSDCLLHPRVTLYHGVTVGARAILHSGVVLGADGFGFAPDPRTESGGWVKIAQLGSVCIGDDVEIGANTTVDRGALDNTVIGHGVKLDNQIMIGHNVYVGDHTAMAACVGVAGSTHIGKRCTIGGAAMLSGHLVLGDDVDVSGGTAITSNIAKAGRYTGVYPHAGHRDWQKNAAVLSQLARLRQRIRKLESL